MKLLSIMTFLSKRTKSGQKHLTNPFPLDMSLTTFRSQRTESSLVPRTHSYPRNRIDVSIQTFFDILTLSMFIKEPAYKTQ